MILSILITKYKTYYYPDNHYRLNIFVIENFLLK